ncbi:MAG: protoporphyrinogen oxidase [Acidobacteriaceae bacterium]|nr:protoporphyrinogen oxidase [Acidobacteriaceae bacterium]
MAERALIVGGGVSGLSTAYFLGRLGISSVLFEKSDRLGGLIKTDVIEECQLEAGPDSYIAAKPVLTELARDLDGLDRQIIGSNDEARRIFIVRGGKLVPMPQGMVMMVPGAWGPAFRSDLFSVSTKLRFLAEVFSSPLTRDEDITVGRLVREHFGDEVLEYLAEPLLSGVYGGDAATLSARSVLARFVAYEQKCGSLIRGVREERRQTPRQGGLFRSFAGGMQSLTDALIRAIRQNTQVVHREIAGIERTTNGWRANAAGEWFESANLVLACPAHAAGRLLGDAAADVAAELAGIPYSSAILVTLVYDRATLGHPLNGFGFLVPCRERQTVAAATWISTKFPSRIPQRFAALRAFIVGNQALRLLDASDAALLDLVRADFRRLMGIHSIPRFSTLYRWPQSMPQYVVGHMQRQQRLAAALRNCTGLHLVGNAYDGVGVPDCVRLAKDTASSILLQSKLETH